MPPRARPPRSVPRPGHARLSSRPLGPDRLRGRAPAGRYGLVHLGAARLPLPRRRGGRLRHRRAGVVAGARPALVAFLVSRPFHSGARRPRRRRTGCFSPSPSRWPSSRRPARSSTEACPTGRIVAEFLKWSPGAIAGNWHMTLPRTLGAVLGTSVALRALGGWHLTPGRGRSRSAPRPGAFRSTRHGTAPTGRVCAERIRRPRNGDVHHRRRRGAGPGRGAGVLVEPLGPGGFGIGLGGTLAVQLALQIDSRVRPEAAVWNRSPPIRLSSASPSSPHRRRVPRALRSGPAR